MSPWVTLFTLPLGICLDLSLLTHLETMRGSGVGPGENQNCHSRQLLHGRPLKFLQAMKD